jgi:hypothetical protein
MQKVTFVLRKVGFGRGFSFCWRVLRFPWEVFVALRAMALGAKLLGSDLPAKNGQEGAFFLPNFHMPVLQLYSTNSKCE